MSPCVWIHTVDSDLSYGVSLGKHVFRFMPLTFEVCLCVHNLNIAITSIAVYKVPMCLHAWDRKYQEQTNKFYCSSAHLHTSILFRNLLSFNFNSNRFKFIVMNYSTKSLKSVISFINYKMNCILYSISESVEWNLALVLVFSRTDRFFE